MLRVAKVMIVVAALTGCSSGGYGPTDSGNPSPSAQTVSVPAGGSAVVPGTDVTIAFRAVTEESRCPLNVVCVWEGNGQVALTLSTAYVSRDVLLNTTTQPRETEFAGIRIALLSLDPYPAGEPIDPDDYVVTLEINDG
jgi:ABC-type glycerol-3-phosphate transport system substrate-binding protein